jgi:hypothetical protein
MKLFTPRLGLIHDLGMLDDVTLGKMPNLAHGDLIYFDPLGPQPMLDFFAS